MGIEDRIRDSNDRDREQITDLFNSKWGKRSLMIIGGAIGGWLLINAIWSAVGH